MLLNVIFLLIIASWIYWVVAWWLVRDFFKAPRQTSDFTPTVSILKPVKGLDAQAYENFVSFCQQDYPVYELLFGVADPDDPAIPVIERLQREFAGKKIRLIIAPAFGMNQKASLLHTLSAQARYDTLVISDSDMRVTPDYLRQVVAPLADENVGLVTCPYRGKHPVTFTARLESLYMGVTFMPSVIVGRQVLQMRFALGATNAMRRGDLNRMGGFAAISDYLADDYQLGWRMSQLGKRVHLSNYVVDSVLGPTTFRDQWDREVRWSHCTRISRPLEYPGLLLSFSTPLSLVFVLLSGLRPGSWLVFFESLVLRWLVAWLVAGYTGDVESRRWIFWLPVRDMLSALIWCAGAVGRFVVWRGERYYLLSDGRIAPVSSPAVIEEVLPVSQRAVRRLDAILRRVNDINEFSSDERCILRLGTSVSDQVMTFSDGTQVCPGDPIGELYPWNEHIPLMPEEGPDLSWMIEFHNRMVFSLGELATHLEEDHHLNEVQAFRGIVPVRDEQDRLVIDSMLARWGFELLLEDNPTGARSQLFSFWENFSTFILIWALTPANLKGTDVRKPTWEKIWISRNVLLKKYGDKKRFRERYGDSINTGQSQGDINISEDRQPAMR